MRSWRFSPPKPGELELLADSRCPLRGPLRNGEYFQLSCQGMRSIAGKLKKQSLEDVCMGLRGSGLINRTSPCQSMPDAGSLLQPDRLHPQGRYKPRDSTYAWKVHMSGRDMILVYCTASVYTRITVTVTDFHRPFKRCIK